MQGKYDLKSTFTTLGTEQSAHLGSSAPGPFTVEMIDLAFKTDGAFSMVDFFIF